MCTLEKAVVQFKKAWGLANAGNYIVSSPKATDLFRQAKIIFSEMARNEDPIACFYLGMMYSSGLGVPQDLRTAIDWFKIAAKNGHAEAMFRVATTLIHGIGKEIPQNVPEAISLYKKSARAGFGPAIWNLAMEYSQGILIERNPRLSQMLFLFMAKRGDPMAMRFVGEALMFGIEPCEKNPTAAFPCLLKGALLGEERCQRRVAEIFLTGAGAPRDPVQAHAWCRVCFPGFQTEGKILHNISKHLSEDDLEKSEKLANFLKQEILNNRKEFEKTNEERIYFAWDNMLSASEVEINE